jgi:HD superfamily phosphohydrolase
MGTPSPYFLPWVVADPVEKIIHDPIYGSIRLSGIVLDLVDVMEVQRLRGIKQLGLAHLVFPGANHSRFEHALGVAYLVERLGHELELSEDELDLLLAAAMLHDIGHPPYSHTLEYLMKDHLGKDHMELTGDILRGNVNLCEPNEREELKRMNVLLAEDVLSKHGISADEVARLLLGKHRIPYLGQIIHSYIDVDQMDYLMRDAHFTGVALGMIDIDRLMRTLIVHKNRLAIASKGIEAVEGLLTARALMFTSVYFHHTVRIAELMLANAVEFAIEQGETITEDNFFTLTDAQLTERLSSMQGYPREIVMRLRYRKLFKTAYVEERRELTAAEKKHLLKRYGEWHRIRELQDEIAERSGIRRGYVILDVPIVDILLSEPRLEKVEVPVLVDGKLVKLSELSPIANALKRRQTPRYLLRVVTPREYVGRVKSVAARVLS